MTIIVDDEKMIVYSKEGKGVKVFPHLKCCDKFMKDVACFMPEKNDIYYTISENGIKLASVWSKHPQGFECSVCNKMKIRQFFGVSIYVKAYKSISPLYFTAISNGLRERLTWEKLVEVIISQQQETKGAVSDERGIDCDDH